ncbi:MAG: SMC-Scp complex subunit ScpB [Ignavibacterium sp.]
MNDIYLNVVEALIFSSDEPIKSTEIIKVIKGIDGDEIQISEEVIETIIKNLNQMYSENNLSFRIIKIAEGLAFATKPEFSKYVGYLSSEKSKRKLSQQALETLAIIAYKQPITKPELEQIRGVNVDYIISTLIEKNLITIVGRAETIGRPLLYGTTSEFLKYFGLNKLSDLPKPREIEEIMNDEDFLEQKRKILMNELEQKIEEELNNSSDDQNS